MPFTQYLYYGKRVYDPWTLRFGGIDPISDQFPELSVYNYASNSPVSNIDLHGLQANAQDIYLKTTLDPNSSRKVNGNKSLGDLFSGIRNFFSNVIQSQGEGGTVGEGVILSTEDRSAKSGETKTATDKADYVDADGLVIPSNKASGGYRNLSNATEKIQELATGEDAVDVIDANVTESSPSRNNSSLVGKYDTVDVVEVPEEPGADTVILRSSGEAYHVEKYNDTRGGGATGHTGPVELDENK